MLAEKGTIKERFEKANKSQKAGLRMYTRFYFPLLILLFLLQFRLSGALERLDYLYYSCCPEKYDIVEGTITEIKRSSYRGVTRSISSYSYQIIVSFEYQGETKTVKFIQRAGDKKGCCIQVAVKENGVAACVRPEQQKLIFSETAAYIMCGMWFAILVVCLIEYFRIRGRQFYTISDEKKQPENKIALENELLKIMPKPIYSDSESDIEMLERGFSEKLGMKVPGPLRFLIENLDLSLLVKLGFSFDNRMKIMAL